MNYKWIFGLAVLLLLVGCKAQQQTPPATPAVEETPVVEEAEEETPPVVETAPAGAEVKILPKGYDPPALSVATGATVKWTNTDEKKGHKVSITGAATSKILGNGESFEYAFTKSGTYQIFDPGLNFKGKVVVE